MHAINPDYPNGGCPSAFVMVEPNGKIDVLLLRYSKFANNSLVSGSESFTSSIDSGVTWSAPISIVGGNGSLITTSRMGTAAWWVNGDLSQDSSGILYASFDTQSGLHDNAWITYSMDDGHSWAKVQKLNPTEDSNFRIEATVSGAQNGTSYASWVQIDSVTGGWTILLEAFQLNSCGIKLSGPQVVSNLTGISGIWGGDTIGLTTLGTNIVAISWGHGVTFMGTNSSQIFAAVVNFPI